MKKDRIDEIFETNNQESDLINYVYELKNNGLNKNEIYSIFHLKQMEYDKIREDDFSNILFDVLDMIGGYYSGKNIEF